MVLVEKIDQNPPVRRAHCEARIYLIPGAKPVKQEAMRIQGERKEGLVFVVDEGVRDGKVESCEGLSASASFPVTTKTPG